MRVISCIQAELLVCNSCKNYPCDPISLGTKNPILCLEGREGEWIIFCWRYTESLCHFCAYSYVQGISSPISDIISCSSFDADIVLLRVLIFHFEYSRQLRSLVGHIWKLMSRFVVF